MNSIASTLRNRTWQKDNYIISTDSSLIPIDTLNEIFSKDEFYWGKPLPEEVMKETLDHSLCFGLYATETADSIQSKAEKAEDPSVTPLKKFVGLARGITDFTTLIYVSDVWIEPSERGNGLGSWLIKCVQEVIQDMPYLRRSLLFTANWEQSVPFYQRLMSMDVMGGQPGESVAILGRKGKGHPTYSPIEQ